MWIKHIAVILSVIILALLSAWIAREITIDIYNEIIKLKGRRRSK